MMITQIDSRLGFHQPAKPTLALRQGFAQPVKGDCVRPDVEEQPIFNRLGVKPLLAQNVAVNAHGDTFRSSNMLERHTPVRNSSAEPMNPCEDALVRIGLHFMA
ncbi:MAG: hypothetical protein ACKO34_05170 [Vampirovibrionales bacterium]